METLVPAYLHFLEVERNVRPATLIGYHSVLGRFVRWLHARGHGGDAADKLDAAALARMGGAVLGAVQEISDVPRGPAREPDPASPARRDSVFLRRRRRRVEPQDDRRDLHRVRPRRDAAGVGRGADALLPVRPHPGRLEI